MQIETSRRRLVLDWLVPLAGCAVVLGLGALFPKTPVDPRLSPVVRLLDSAFSSWIGIGYLCLLAAWWTYRLIRHGQAHDLLGAVAITLEITGLLLFSLESPVGGLVLIGAGLAVWAVAHVSSTAEKERGQRTTER